MRIPEGIRPYVKGFTGLLFLFLFGLLMVRAFSDHSLNNHYTGDRSSEIDLIHALKNFDRFGLVETRFMPIHKPLESLYQEPKVPYYSHYPALPYLVIYLPYQLFGQSEAAARFVSILISIAGLGFALWSVRRIQILLQSKDSGHQATLWERVQPMVLLVLALNPIFLCYGDTLYEQPMIAALQWAALAWCLEYLFFGASLSWGVLIYFLNVWVSFDWLVPLFLIFGFCIYRREGFRLKNLAPWLWMYGVGVAGSVALRMVHNSWALGGFWNAVQDFASVGTLQAAAGRGAAQYSATKHLAKLLIGVPWFATFPALILAGAGVPLLWRRLRDVTYLRTLVVSWVIGSFSWQLLMRRESMVHGFTYIHPACGVLLIAALAVPILWQARPKFVLACIAFQCILGGVLISSEIVNPFVVSSSRALVAQVCESDGQGLMTRFATIDTSMATLIRHDLATPRSSRTCDNKSKISSAVLAGYAGIFKMTLLPPTP